MACSLGLNPHRPQHSLGLIPSAHPSSPRDERGFSSLLLLPHGLRGLSGRHFRIRLALHWVLSQSLAALACFSRCFRLGIHLDRHHPAHRHRSSRGPSLWGGLGGSGLRGGSHFWRSNRRPIPDRAQKAPVFTRVLNRRKFVQVATYATRHFATFVPYLPQNLTTYLPLLLAPHFPTHVPCQPSLWHPPS